MDRNKKRKGRSWPAVGLAFWAATAGIAHAHSGAQHELKARRTDAAADHARAEQLFGRAADPGQAGKTITVDMSDRMRFSPSEIRVSRGDTVRFVVRNEGRVLHEMVLGTRKDLEEHAQLMRKFPEMEHEEPHMVHVAPGNAGEIGWQFTRPGEFYYGCLIPGHFEAGMVGKVIVQ